MSDTVANVLARLYGSYPEAVDNCKALGVNPNMPFEQFQRWLRYGQKADEIATGQVPVLARRSGYLGGQLDLLDAIKGDDQ